MTKKPSQCQAEIAMSEREAKFVVIAAVLIALAFLFGIAAGNGTTSMWWERVTVSKGFAEYLVDDSGGVKWQWKETR